MARTHRLQVAAGRPGAWRTGQLSGLDGDIFYLLATEVLDLPAGKPVPVETISARRETDGRYRSLPP